MKGILTFYVKYVPDKGETPEQVIDLIKSLNSEVFEKIKEDGEYLVMFVPTTGESSRLERTEFPDNITLDEMG